MKKTSILINTARGALVDEEALRDAINDHEISGAGIDVYKEEPLPMTSPLYQIKDQDRILMTPHIGWGSVEARNQVIKEVYLNVKAYLEGKSRNIVNEKS